MGVVVEGASRKNVVGGNNVRAVAPKDKGPLMAGHAVQDLPVDVPAAARLVPGFCQRLQVDQGMRDGPPPEDG